MSRWLPAVLFAVGVVLGVAVSRFIIAARLSYSRFSFRGFRLASA